jgi:hypothetical protein
VRFATPGTTGIPARSIGLIIVFGVSFWWLTLHVDLYSYLPDDGAYAYVADRINHGDVLNRDIHDVHAGYVHFMNSWALRLFGDSLLSLRYPLLFLTVLQTLIVFWLSSRQSLMTGFLCAAVMTGLTFIQFLNPTANWYCLFIVIVLGATLERLELDSFKGACVAGLLVGVVFFFRQLTGIIVAAAVLVLILMRISRRHGSEQRSAVVAFVVPVVLALGFVLFRSNNLGSAVLFGTWPIAVCVSLLLTLRAPNRKVLERVAQFATGFSISAMPLLAYHAWTGSLTGWWNDTVRAAVQLSGMKFISGASFVELPVLSAEGLAREPGIGAALNGMYWTLLILAPAFLGIALIRRLRTRDGESIPPLVWLAMFYALVSLHYQIPIYLMYGSGLVLVALLLISTPARRRSAYAIRFLVCFCLAIGILYQSARPLSVPLADVLRGSRGDAAVKCDLERLGLRVEPHVCKKYQRLVHIVRTRSRPTQSILALPANPELYFLGNRRSTLGFYNSAFGVLGEDQERIVEHTLATTPPALVFFQPSDKYNDRNTSAIMKSVSRNYDRLTSVGEFEIFARPDRISAVQDGEE